jgi:preprotein translocase subunit YajC
MQNNLLPNLFVLAAFLLAFFFLVMGPQRRKMRDHNNLIANLKIGDRIITYSGIYGKITSLEEKKAELEIADGVRIAVVKDAIGSVIQSENE